MGNLLSIFMDRQMDDQEQLLTTTTTAQQQQSSTTKNLLAAFRDPRSPTFSFRRTPLASANRGAGKYKQQYAFDSDPSDPRSPSLAFKRTPLAHGVIDYKDPRSPMANRTPVARLLFNLNDPREPSANRTPLSSLASNSAVAAHRINRRLIDDMLVEADADDSMCSFGSTSHDDDNDVASDGFDDAAFVDIPLDDATPASDEVQLADDDDDIDDESEDLCDAWALPTIAKPARYMLLTPKARPTARLSLCAVKSAVANAMAASSPLATKAALAASLDDSFSSSCSNYNAGETIGTLIGASPATAKRDAPPSPFAVLKAAGLRTTPLGSQQRASCPSSPAA